MIDLTENVFFFTIALGSFPYSLPNVASTKVVLSVETVPVRKKDLLEMNSRYIIFFMEAYFLQNSI